MQDIIAEVLLARLTMMLKEITMLSRMMLSAMLRAISPSAVCNPIAVVNT